MIDIIIPVHNGYSFFRNCFESVIKHTNITHRIIILNDKSKEKLLLNYLDSLKKLEIKNLIILNHNRNLGFVKTVNKGMRLSNDNDVILLNSDTVVTKDWLKKIRNCAYSSEIIATVTPLSNNAAFCSVPDFEINNELPTDFTIDSFSTLIEEKSLGLYPEIPTGVGFCMYIKREALNVIGYFDEKYFGKGYGEENDFCMRVKKAGLINILDDSTFIYHKGCGSFTDNEKRSLQKRNLKIINMLHPEYFSTISNFYLENPLKPILGNINFWLENYSSEKKNILYVKHFEPSVGGVGINLQQIINSSPNYNIYVFSPTETDNISLSMFQAGKETGTWEFKINKTFKFNNNNDEREIENLFVKIINYFNVNLVHFQHLRGLPLSLIKTPSQLNIPCVISLHDYFLISNEPDLLQINKSKKPFFFKKPEDYIKHIFKYSKVSKKTEIENVRFKRIVKLLEGVDICVAPSNFVKSQFKKIFPSIPITLIEHGTDLEKNQTKIFTVKKPLTVAFLGAGALNKGIIDFIKLSKDKRLKGMFIWKIIGGIDYKLIDDSGFSQALGNIKQIGAYKLNKLPEILNKENVDLVIILSNTPEAYSYTLSESIQSNIPVIGRDIGALGERIKQYKAGWTIRNYDDSFKLLENLYKNQNLIADRIKQLENIRIYHSSEMAHLYTKLYTKLMLKQKNRANPIHNKRVEYNRFFYQNMVYTNITHMFSKDLFGRIKMLVRTIPIVGAPSLILLRKIKTTLLHS